MPRKAKSVSMVVLSNNKEEQKAIAEAMGAFDAKIVFSSTMHHLREALFEKPCNGILFCIASLVGIDEISKSFAQTLEQVYPVARIRWNKASKSFSLIASRGGRVETLHEFISICSGFAPRRLRRNERFTKTLNVLLSATPDLAHSTRAFTTNISPRGCFLHTPREWKAGDAVFIQIQEMPGKSVIEGKVIRYVPWGIPFRVQGIGLQFVNLENKQVEKLNHLLHHWPFEH
jgi:Tfp pilus assembly protein PilZ